MFRHTLTVAAKDLRLRFRDRSLFLVGFVGPVVIAAILGGAFGGGGFNAQYAIADSDGSDVSATLASRAFASLDSDVKEVTAEQARKLVSEGEVSAAVIIPAGFGAAVRAGESPRVDVIRYAGSEIGADVAVAVVTGWLERISTVRLAAATASSAGLPVDPDTISGRLDAAPPNLAVVATGGGSIDPVTYFGPAMAVFFLLFSAGFAARSILAETQSGTLDRIVAAPLKPGSVVAGKALATFVIGLSSMSLTFVALNLMFGARWGPWYLTALVAVASVGSMIGLMSFIASMAKTEQAAEAMVGLAGLALAVIGGNFLPVDMLPFGLRQIAPFTPNGRALQAFTDLAVGEGFRDLFDDLRVLGAYAVVGGALAVWRVRKQFAR